MVSLCMELTNQNFLMKNKTKPPTGGWLVCYWSKAVFNYKLKCWWRVHDTFFFFLFFWWKKQMHRKLKEKKDIHPSETLNKPGWNHLKNIKTHEKGGTPMMYIVLLHTLEGVYYYHGTCTCRFAHCNSQPCNQHTKG